MDKLIKEIFSSIFFIDVNYVDIKPNMIIISLPEDVIADLSIINFTNLMNGYGFPVYSYKFTDNKLYLNLVDFEDEYELSQGFTFLTGLPF